MIDLIEMNIMFTLNGEMLTSDSGSDMAFKDIEIGEGKSSIVILPFYIYILCRKLSCRSQQLQDNFAPITFAMVLPLRFHPSVCAGPVSSGKDQSWSECQQSALFCHLRSAGRL